MNSKALRAGLFLAFQFALHILRRGKARIIGHADGYDRFMENFSREGIWSFRPEERDMHYEFSRCINCGLCLYGPGSSAPGFSANEPRFFAVSYDRDLGSTGTGVIMSSGEGDKAVEMCPTRVPLGKMLSFKGGKR